MDKLRRTCATTLALGLLVAPQLLLAGHDNPDGPFSRLDPPIPTDAAGKIEVIEFFWYGCPHCAKVEPFVETWEKQLPADVVFRREHVVWASRPETRTHAQVFATLRAMDLVGVHQGPADWAAKRGIDQGRFESMYKSFTVNSQIARMKSLTEAYKIEGVPIFVVNGKYVTAPGRAGGERQMFDFIDGLIAQERTAVKR